MLGSINGCGSGLGDSGEVGEDGLARTSDVIPREASAKKSARFRGNRYSPVNPLCEWQVRGWLL